MRPSGASEKAQKEKQCLARVLRLGAHSEVKQLKALLLTEELDPGVKVSVQRLLWQMRADQERGCAVSKRAQLV